MPNIYEENFTQLPAYVVTQAKNLIRKQVSVRDDLTMIDNAKETVSSIGSVIIKDAITDDVKSAAREKVWRTFRDDVDTLRSSTKETLETMRKTAVQEYYKVKPRPTDIERGEILALVREYRDSEAPDKEQDFKARRTFHIENETVEAVIYILAGKELGIGADVSEFDITVPTFDYGVEIPKIPVVQEMGGLLPLDAKTFNKTEEGKRLNRIYEERVRAAKVDRQIQQNETYIQQHMRDSIDPKIQFQTDQLLMKFCPAMKTAQYHLDCVIEAERLFNILLSADKIFAYYINAGGLDFSNGAKFEKVTMDEYADIKTHLIGLGCNSNGLFNLLEIAAKNRNIVDPRHKETYVATLIGEMIGYIV